MLNVMSGDVLMGNVQKSIVYYDVVWDKLFDTDQLLYANVVIPYNNLNLVDFNETEGSDVVLSIYIKALYHPENSVFKIRFVTNVDGVYHNVHEYKPAIPSALDCLCRTTYGSEPVEIKACQLPMVNIDGNYRILVIKGEDESYKVNLFSASSTDFIVSDNEDQAAQLLAICGPGKYYRYPTTGVDVTKYINSVVHHTDIGENLYDQFKADNKDISDADFDSNTGVLDTKFNSYSVTDPNVQLLDVSLLDTKLFRFATDEYVCAVVQAMRDGIELPDPEDYNTNTSTDSTTSWMGIYTNDKTYKTNSIVSYYGSVFVAKSNNLRGLAPLSVDGNGQVALANTDSWNCIVDNINLYNESLLSDRKVLTTDTAMAKMISNRTWEPGVTYYSIERE